ncbi:P-loop containing nucleoside triphosphate hydrolase protein [Teratosphaeria nubilosa]|uniref:P-loop containing nucleoside triphosphate hydrolase protein n=1 Tax=Teratosphaeria nubilosa TaxID=161662 RepID=A0A6G1L7H5_9PEZI|nr:P-loop containing nucleoside triphosphate hydrolase protein [Teratosphaeria nubilosa]
MNEDLLERFRGAGRGRRQQPVLDVWIQPQQLNLRVREYISDASRPVDGGAWLRRPEIPTASEILDTDVSSATSSDIVEIATNKPVGPWDSKESYLSAHYELLREDAVRPLREAVSQVRITPSATEDAFNGTIGIYEKVHICAITCSSRGLAVRATFSLHRTGKKILWEQSKRLITGSLVVLTPAEDMFQKTAIVATVAARPLEGLAMNPPELDLFIARAEEMELDPAKEFVMVEERSGFYEADRHTLLALQHMMREPFPLSENLVKARREVLPPQYVVENPVYDLTSVLRNNKHETYENVHILQAWPSQPSSDLDASQIAALHHILARKLAIVQGPPGTGKTFVSVQAIKIMLANRKHNDPPIIIACQTNHAVDQILRHIAAFEPDFARLGGRSKDVDVIKPRTLHKLREMAESQTPLAGSLYPMSRKKMKEVEKELALLLSPLKPSKTPMDFRLLEQLGVLTAKQSDSLEHGASKWVQDALSNTAEARTSPFTVWLGKNLVPVPVRQQAEEFGFEFEEADLAFEQLRELEAENVTKDDEDYETLSGSTYTLADNFTGRKVAGVTNDKVKAALKEQDMWKISEMLRPAVYRHLQREMKSRILVEARDKVLKYNKLAVDRRAGTWERDETILKHQHIIGMTTTGLSKYRGLLHALQPKIVLIEEAAETLEAPVTVACLPSVQHLILVGDHKQLRPHTHVKSHEDKPYYLNISLFERMVNNQVEFDSLAKQRRMIPEIRRILQPIYGDLIKDHPSVLNPANRPDVPGMGGVNSYFFTHQWNEARDEHMSAYNQSEADMIVGFVEYLYFNGTDTKDITVLTFYNGQRKRILSALMSKGHLRVSGCRFNVVTVDSYQGEENQVVLLSLVRSNKNGQIGFLGIDNRVCVALSRAKCGFYLFGNGMLLYQNKTWRKVIEIMAGKKLKHERPQLEPMRLGEQLPLKCRNHNETVVIKSADDFEGLHGGCQLKCKDKLPCGHGCDLNCHPFSHEMFQCGQVCGKQLPCGHGLCEQRCGQLCVCKTCSKPRPIMANITGQPGHLPFDGQERLSQHSRGTSNSDSWKSFAKEEHERYSLAAAAPAPPLREVEYTTQLLDITNDEAVVEHVSLLTVADVKECGKGKARAKDFQFGLDGSRSKTPSEDSSEEAGVSSNGLGERKSYEEVVTLTPRGAVPGHGQFEKEDWSQRESLLD